MSSSLAEMAIYCKDFHDEFMFISICNTSDLFAFLFSFHIFLFSFSLDGLLAKIPPPMRRNVNKSEPTFMAAFTQLMVQSSYKAMYFIGSFGFEAGALVFAYVVSNLVNVLE